MKKVLCILFLLIVTIPCLQAENVAFVFSDDKFGSRLEYAKALNSKGRYMEAYDYLKDLHSDVLTLISRHGFVPATVPDVRDFIFYQNVLVSEAECAYMVNLWTEMEALSDEQVTAINDRYDAGLGRNDDYSWQVASFYKIRGDFCYLRGMEDRKMYRVAEDCYKAALKYFELSGDMQARSGVLADMAQLSYARGSYEEAMEYIQKAIDGNSTRLASGSNARESFTGNGSYSVNLEYQSALAMCQARTYSFRKALGTIDALIAGLPKGDRRLAELNRRKAKILILQNEENGSDIRNAAKLYEEYFLAIKDSVKSNFLQMTADQREEYWMHQRPFVVDCYQLENRDPELLYDVTLYNKGILLQTARSFEDLLDDGEHMRLSTLKRQDARNALDGHPASEAQVYEKQVLGRMAADGRRKKFFAPLEYTWKDVQKVLPSDGCAIEFVEYEKGEDMLFGALVLKKTGKPVFVRICNADVLENYRPRGWMFSLGTLMKTNSGMAKDDIYRDETLKAIIWNAGLVDQIGRCSKIYFSADGFLHQLAIEYMLPESMEDRILYRLSSTRVLASGEKADSGKIKNGAALVMGGIVYDSLGSGRIDDASGNDAWAYRIMKEKGVSFGYMPGAKTECDSIVSYRNNAKDRYLGGLEATETAFYENCNSYPVVHLSTHGYFGGDMTVRRELLASSAKDVLSQSVLALSGAGNNLKNPDFDAFSRDGLLSAREVARLDMSGVELLTTSACQTGLGYVTADGIYGMQRGFKSAGVKGMLMTLWSVNVESARIFFTSLYRYMEEGESVHSAFMHSRRDLMENSYTVTHTVSKFSGSTLSRKDETYTTTLQYNTPQHTCPYILMDVWD